MSTVVMTATVEELDHFVKVRADKAAQNFIRDLIAVPIKEYLEQFYSPENRSAINNKISYGDKSNRYHKRQQHSSDKSKSKQSGNKQYHNKSTAKQKQTGKNQTAKKPFKAKGKPVNRKFK